MICQSDDVMISATMQLKMFCVVYIIVAFSLFFTNEGLGKTGRLYNIKHTYMMLNIKCCHCRTFFVSQQFDFHR